MGRPRFLFPLIFSIAGISSTIAAIHWITKDFPFLSFFSFIPGTLYTDILVVIAAAIPMAALYLLGHKIIKAAAFDTDIMHLGPNFGGIRMLRRAALPALFSVSTAGLARSLLST
jgi:hypothetical protein